MTGITFRGYIGTIDRLREYPCQCRLSDAMESEKDISVVESACFTGIGEDFFHEILTDDIGEIFRAIALIERHFLETNTKRRIRRTGIFYRDICGCKPKSRNTPARLIQLAEEDSDTLNRYQEIGYLAPSAFCDFLCFCQILLKLFLYILSELFVMDSEYPFEIDFARAVIEIC